MLFNESQCLNGLTGGVRDIKKVKDSAMKRWDRGLREVAATKRQLCDLAERMDCPPGNRS